MRCHSICDTWQKETKVLGKVRCSVAKSCFSWHMAILGKYLHHALGSDLRAPNFLTIIILTYRQHPPPHKGISHQIKHSVFQPDLKASEVLLRTAFEEANLSAKRFLPGLSTIKLSLQTGQSRTLSEQFWQSRWAWRQEKMWRQPWGVSRGISKQMMHCRSIRKSSPKDFWSFRVKASTWNEAGVLDISLATGGCLNFKWNQMEFAGRLFTLEVKREQANFFRCTQWDEKLV